MISVVRFSTPSKGFYSISSLYNSDEAMVEKLIMVLSFKEVQKQLEADNYP